MINGYTAERISLVLTQIADFLYPVEFNSRLKSNNCSQVFLVHFAA